MVLRDGIALLAQAYCPERKRAVRPQRLQREMKRNCQLLGSCNRYGRIVAVRFNFIKELIAGGLRGAGGAVKDVAHAQDQNPT